MSRTASTSLILILVILAVVCLGLGFGTNTFDVKLPIVLLFAVVMILLISDTKYWWLLYLLSVASIAVGHRGIYLGQATFLIPMEIISLLLGLLALASTKSPLQGKKGQVPWELLVFTAFLLVRGIVAFISGDSLDLIASWNLPFVFGLPIFFVSSYFISSLADMRIAIRVLFLSTIYISLTAIVEYFVPSIKTSVPFIFTGNVIIAQDGFVRAGFSAFGYPAAATIVTWGILIGYSEYLHPRFGINRYLLVIGTICGIVAVYISGQRSSWICLGIGFILLSLSIRRENRLRGLIIISLAVSVVMFLLPQDFWVRLATSTEIATGDVTDTSTQQRLDRWDWASQSITEAPLWGVGYDHWLVHNVFLEIGSTAGVIPMIIFAIFVFRYLLRIVRLFSATSRTLVDGWLWVALCISWLVFLNIETSFNVPPLAVAQWLIVAIGWRVCELYYMEQPVQAVVVYTSAIKTT